MKKILVSAMVVLGTLTMSANFNSLEFKNTDGSVTTVGTAGLVILVNGNTLTVSNTAGDTYSFDATTLATMQFADDDGMNAIHGLSADRGKVTVYSISGIIMGEYPSLESARGAMQEGTYVVKYENGQTVKIIKER